MADERFDALTIGAAAATAALAWALARAVGLVVPGVDLVLTTAMVFVIAIGVRQLPEPWRRGPRLGGAVLAGIIGFGTAAIALGEATAVIRAGTPWWSADLAAWPAEVAAWTPYGWQVPATLLLAAAAAWTLLPAPAGGRVGFLALSLAGLSAPAALGLPWWSAPVLALSLSVLAGVGAATIGDAGLARERVVTAAALGIYATAAAMARPQAAAWTMIAIAVAGVLVAVLAQLPGAELAAECAPHPRKGSRPGTRPGPTAAPAPGRVGGQ